VIIYNLSGEVVYRKKLKPQVSEVLDVSKIKKGFYIISLYEEWGPVVSKRIVKI